MKTSLNYLHFSFLFCFDFLHFFPDETESQPTEGEEKLNSRCTKGNTKRLKSSNNRIKIISRYKKWNPFYPFPHRRLFTVGKKSHPRCLWYAKISIFWHLAGPEFTPSTLATALHYISRIYQIFDDLNRKYLFKFLIKLLRSKHSNIYCSSNTHRKDIYGSVNICVLQGSEALRR